MALPKALEASAKRLFELESEAKQLDFTIKAVRDSLLAIMKMTKNQKFSTETSSFTIVESERPVIREEELKSYMKKKEIPLTEAFDRIYVLNERKLLELIKSGRVSKKQLKKMTDLKKGNPYVRMGKPAKEDNLGGTIKKAQAEG